ncbi:MAG: hypothetical protein R3B93_11985 [Bacteroidia bacterium]
MAELGYDTQFTSMDYTSGSPAAFGNYIGRLLIEFGLQDGSNEQNNLEMSIIIRLMDQWLRPFRGRIYFRF